MHDQSFNKHTLERVLKKSDFRGVISINHEAFRNSQLTNAETSAFSLFNEPLNPLSSFPLKNKPVYRLPKLSDELVARKICENLKKITQFYSRGRSVIVGNLQLLLEEGIPYSIYRLDVKSFYESFNPIELVEKIDDLSKLSTHSKILIKSLLISYAKIGGLGVPRGLSLSAILSDLMMQNFDSKIFSFPHVYFYARYVDDIIIITSAQEKQVSFIKNIEVALPSGLKLNQKKKTIVTIEKRVTPEKSHSSTSILNFDYLGYKFSVYEPIRIKKDRDGAHFRVVTVDIANTKIKKLKTRIIRSFLDFSKTNDWLLLLDRMKFLTQNFSVYNSKVGSKKLAGIYYSYPYVSDKASSLKELDSFLRNAILSNTGKLFSKTTLKLNTQQKRTLLAQSFAHGHESRSFIHFPALRISNIQKCWLY